MSNIHHGAHISSIDFIQSVHDIRTGNLGTISNAGIINQHIQAAVRFDGFIDDPLNIIVISNVGDDLKCLFEMQRLVS